MKYAIFFLACSVGLVVVAFPWTASSVLKLWGSLALGVVGLGYAGVGPRIFGKGSDGRMRPLNVLILAPYLLLLWSVWHLSRALRRESPFNELVEGINHREAAAPGRVPGGNRVGGRSDGRVARVLPHPTGSYLPGIPDPRRVTLRTRGARADRARERGWTLKPEGYGHGGVLSVRQGLIELDLSNGFRIGGVEPIGARNPGGSGASTTASSGHRGCSYWSPRC